MSGLEQLRRDLRRPYLTEAGAEPLFTNPECSVLMNAAARMYYCKGKSTADIAWTQCCSRGPVINRLKVWRERAKAMLEADR